VCLEVNKLDYDKSKAIYKQIIESFQKQLVRGELRQGDKIPSQRDFALKARVNPNTVQRAYQELERMGMVETLRGQGTFIRADEAMVKCIREQMAAALLEHFQEEMHSLGYDDQQIYAMFVIPFKGKKEEALDD